MANQAAKKAQKASGHLSTQLYQWIGAINIIYVLYRVMWHYESFSSAHMYGYGFLLLTTYFCAQTLIAAAAEGGSSEYAMDVLILTFFVQVGSLISDYFWFIYLLIPGYLGYLALRKYLDYVFTPDASDEPLTDAEIKRQKKKERKAERGQIRYRR